MKPLDLAAAARRKPQRHLEVSRGFATRPRPESCGIVGASL